MKLVQTLLARDEADIVDVQLAFHLNAGVDFVIATDNRSEDGTTEILERYEREGHLHLIREPGDDYRQSEWVTRMARLAATEHGADWILNTDADEFWWPREGSLKDVLRAVPERYGVVRGAWRIFVPLPDDERLFWERMTVRLCNPDFHDHPLSTHWKSAHRAAADVRIGRGNHEAFSDALLPLRGWYPIEILHYPVRSRAQCERKYVTQFVTIVNNAEKGIPEHWITAYDLVQSGAFEDFYAPLLARDGDLERGLADGTLAIDTRLRDALRTLFSERPSMAFEHPSAAADAGFAAESSALAEADFALSLGGRIDELERRLGRLEQGVLRRLPGAVVRAVHRTRGT